MAHHKRKRAKQRRSGCLWCKYWKHPGFKHRGDVKELRRSWKQEKKAHDAEKEWERGDHD